MQLQSYAPQPGDIAACYGRDPLSLLITLGTYWPLSPPGLRIGPSHVALIAPGPSPEGRTDLWYESTTMAPRPCLLQGQGVSGVQAHHWHDRVADYVDAGARVAIYRLSPYDRLMSHEVSQLERLLTDKLVAQVEYDMGGALTSGARGMRWLLNQFGASNSRLYCSDLIAFLLMRLNRLPAGNSNKYTPGRLLRVLVRNGVYGRHCVISKAGIAT